jgi:hypothetical protein
MRQARLNEFAGKPKPSKKTRDGVRKKVDEMGFYNREDFAEFKVRERGPADHRLHSIELSTSYNPAFCGGGGKTGALMLALPKGSCYFDGEGGKVWRLLDEYKDDAIALALHYFKNVYEVAVDGITTTNHKTGGTYAEPKLF